MQRQARGRGGYGLTGAPGEAGEEGWILVVVEGADLPGQLVLRVADEERRLALLVVPGAALLHLLAPWLVDVLYPDRWQAAVPALRALCWAAAAWMVPFTELPGRNYWRPAVCSRDAKPAMPRSPPATVYLRNM